MANKEPELALETHELVIPYCSVVCGRVFEMPLECVFGYSGDLTLNHVIEIVSLTGKDSEGLTYDMSYLVEDDESPLARHIIAVILNNHKNWNSEDETWWDNVSRGLTS